MMRVSPVTLNNIHGYNQIRNANGSNNTSIAPHYAAGTNNLAFMPVYQIPFTSIQNSSKLRTLFRYRLPCIYSGIPMIDPKQFSKLLKSGVFDRSSAEAVKALSEFDECYSGMERRIVNILSARSKIHPEMNIKQLLTEIEPVYRRKLRREQSGIFHNIGEYFKELPPEYQENFGALMAETNKRLNEKPVFIPFSAYEFKYKLAKIRDVILNQNDLKAKKVINKMTKESKKLSNSTNNQTYDNQKKVLGMLDWILKKSVLKDNEELKDLITTSKARLKNKEVVIPFSRKSFLYDLHRITYDIPNKEIQSKILNEANKLPTSSQDFSAYMVKIAAETPERIASRILWPYIASVEHIVPRSVGGPDAMSNFAGATTRENSIRKSIDFTEQMKLRPNTPYYCQKYVNKLTELYKRGIFSKYGISPKYIEDFKNTIYKVSKGQIDLDISEYEKLKG